VSGGADRTVKVWDLPVENQPRPLIHQRSSDDTNEAERRRVRRRTEAQITLAEIEDQIGQFYIFKK